MSAPALVATPAAVNANTYATLAEANAYHTARLHNEEWTAAAVTDDTKNAALLWATRTLDDMFQWVGRKQSKEQALDWPRYGVYDDENYYVDQLTIPKRLKEAQSELAFLLIKQDRTSAQDGGGLKSLTVDVISLEFDSMDRLKAIPPNIAEMLSAFGASKSSDLRSVKVARV